MMDPTNIEAIYALSPVQQGILFHSEMAGAADPYLGQIAITLNGPVNIETLERSWCALASHHSILRTAFVSERRGRPMQVVLKSIAVSLRQLDWRRSDPNTKEHEWNSFLAADRKSGFDHSKAPLFRLTLVRFEDALYRLLWTEHHLILDGWSVPLLLNELSAVYGAEMQGETMPMPAGRPYRDYIDWLAKQNTAAAETYWRTLLQGVEGTTLLPSTRRATVSEPGVEIAYLNSASFDRIREIARAHRVTLNVVVQAAWAVLLSRYTDSAAVVYGATTSGRPPELDGVEGIAGPFINTLPVHVRILPTERFSDLCRSLQEQQLNTQRFEYTPLVEIQKWTGAGVGRPLFEAIFVFENYPSRSSEARTQYALPLGPMTASEQSSFPLALLAGASDRLVLKALYDANRFDVSFIASLLGHLKKLLEQIATTRDGRVADLRIVTSAEQRTVDAWSGSTTAYPRDLSISEVFAQQLGLRGSTIALKSPSGVWTYGELDRRSNQLARHLRAQGVGLEDVVGVFAERGPAMIVALLGILKAGAAYLPLDVNNPAARLHYILSDCGCRWIVADRNCAALSGVLAEVILLDRDAVTIGAASSEPLDAYAGPSNAAYVMYTSGSTGKPKGTTVEHRAVMRLVKSANYVSISPEDVFLQFAPLAFDASTFEIWGSLLNGARLVLAPPQLPTLQELAETISGSGITLLWLTGGLFRPMIETHSAELVGVRQLLAGGEALPVTSVREALRLLPETRLINGYGPTENCTFTCCHAISLKDALLDSIPIGRPISNTRVYILDRDLQPVAPGMAGELYTAGDGLARDYRGSAALTAERFLPNPFSINPGARMYRIGDRARFLADGVVEFLGRIDGQVKVRGFRIEIEEIESVLAAHPSIRQCAVGIRRTDSGDASIMAFAVARNGSLESQTLRKHLEFHLPPYMIPLRIIERDTLPLTSNGKIDRQALVESCAEQAFAPAALELATPVEEVLAGVWRDLLRTSVISRSDDFFQLGGHSLLAMQAISRIRDLFASPVPLRFAFDHPTLAGLASEIERFLRHNTEPVASFPVAPRNGELALSLAQQRLWFLDRLEPGNRFYNMHLAFRLTGELDVPALERALLALGLRHESLRTTFPARDGEPLQLIAASATFRLRILQAAEDSVGQTVQREAHAPFDLASGPLFRPVLMQVSPYDHILLLVMHHIISDGRSVSVLIEELSRLYSGDTLSPMQAQYADYAAWELQWLLTPELDRLREYWRHTLADAPAPLNLSGSRPRPAMRSFSGATLSRLLPGCLADQADALSRREGATRFMIFLAAYYLLLRRHAVQDDLIVGADVANRNHSETQGTIGFFVNQLPLRMKISADEPFRALVVRVRRMTMDAYTHHDLPFQNLLEVLKVERRLNHASLFQTKLLYQRGEGAAPSFRGVTAEPYPVPLDSSAFDLVLAILDSPGQLLATFEYDTDLLDATPVSRMAEDFEIILALALADPNLTVKAIDTQLDESERRRRDEERRARETAGFKLLRSVKAAQVSH